MFGLGVSHNTFRDQVDHAHAAGIASLAGTPVFTSLFTISVAILGTPKDVPSRISARPSSVE